ncbi:hypothetical protein H8B04_04335 [Sphingobacterium sp. DN04309]|uniref:Uncharacterized protein n=1 Tax=Sphingobacterium litopenaei TaxID=2763500 RepID=A0ABR7YBX8_9SPHI|nr:hypothetical protein [Sphingobacterium litopenaei]MBD1428806.1 hypothetical protein [Sphingobacterium litopenaei]
MERLEYIKELYSQYLAKNISKQGQKELMEFFNTCNDTELQYIVGSLDPDEQIIESELQRYGQRADDVLDRIRKKTATKDICISFAACKVYKELERLLKEKNAGYSAEQTIEIIKTIYKVKIQTPYSEQIYERLIIKNDDQKAIVDLFDLDLN